MQTSFPLASYINLEWMLLAKPDLVLRKFKVCQISDLMEIPAFQRVLTENPLKAAHIKELAATYGISCGKPG